MLATQEGSQDWSSQVKTTDMSDVESTQCFEDTVVSVFLSSHDYYGERYAFEWDKSSAKDDSKLTTDIDKLKATDKQVGGSHYRDLKIQPTEYIVANKLGWCEGNIVKYITRHQVKGGINDLDKVIHYAELAKQLQYGEE
jgi:hypothetical protein